ACCPVCRLFGSPLSRSFLFLSQFDEFIAPVSLAGHLDHCAGGGVTVIKFLNLKPVTSTIFELCAAPRSFLARSIAASLLSWKPTVFRSDTVFWCARPDICCGILRRRVIFALSPFCRPSCPHPSFLVRCID